MEGDDPAYYTNEALRQNLRLGIPVAVLIQVREKPQPRYLVRGLADVVAEGRDFFDLRGVGLKVQQDFPSPPDGKSLPASPLKQMGGVDIAPGLGVYAMFQSFNYKPWFALAEFVDNSISSYQENRPALESLHGPDFVLEVQINFDERANVLTIEDNAAGISQERYDGAFALATPPPDRDYLSQYGVGMKAAAFWFCGVWSVRTSALGEPFETELELDRDEIIRRNVPVLPPPTRRIVATIDHYTKITLEDLTKPPTGGRTIGKIRSYLANIYREFISSGRVKILWQGQALEAWVPKVLIAPRWDDPEGAAIEWHRDFVLSGGSGLGIPGSAYLLETMDKNYPALNLFWHGRLIRGNFEPYYRPEEIFKAPNSFEHRRIGIDLRLDEFLPTIDKQNFRFDDTGLSEEQLIELLQAELSKEEFPLLQQANKYRSREAEPEEVDDEDSLESIGGSQGSGLLRDAGELVLTDPEGPVSENPYPPPPLVDLTPWSTEIEIVSAGQKWNFTLSLSTSPASNHFVDVTEILPEDSEDLGEPRRLRIAIGYHHPFVKYFWRPETKKVFAFIAMSLCYAEVTARAAGAFMASSVRTNLDKALRLIGEQVQRG
jgi:hypothetical protein